MNKFLTFSGLQPIYLGDIDFLQESVRKTFLQLLVGLTGQEKPSCILQKATDEKDGIICLDGEIMPYKKYTGGGLVSSYSYQVVSGYSGDRTFKNGEKHQCYESRYAQEVAGPLLGGGIDDFDTLLWARLKVPRATSVYNTENMTAPVSFSKIGNVIYVEMKFNFTASVTLTQLFNNQLIAIPSSIVGQGTKFSCLTALVGGELVNIPAQISFTRALNSASSYISLGIPSTQFNPGDSGMLCLTLIDVTL